MDKLTFVSEDLLINILLIKYKFSLYFQRPKEIDIISMKKILLTTLIPLFFSCLSKHNDRSFQNLQEIQVIEDQVNILSNRLKPIKDISLKYLKQGGILDKDVIRIYNLTWESPLQYAITIFNPAPDSYFEKYKKDNNLGIPVIYEQFLKEMNGCYLFDFTLFGLSPTIYEPEADHKSFNECYDIAIANREWKQEYMVDSSLFYFGARTYLYNENIGYFIDSSGAIKAVKYNGNVLNEWTSFTDFLKDEIKEAEDLMIYYMPYDEMEKLGIPVH